MKLLLVVLGVVCIVFGVLEAFMISPADAFKWVSGVRVTKKKWTTFNFASSSLRLLLMGICLFLLAYTLDLNM